MRKLRLNIHYYVLLLSGFSNRIPKRIEKISIIIFLPLKKEKVMSKVANGGYINGAM